MPRKNSVNPQYDIVINKHFGANCNDVLEVVKKNAFDVSCKKI